jgi:hypothetical protein
MRVHNRLRRLLRRFAAVGQVCRLLIAQFKPPSTKNCYCERQAGQWSLAGSPAMMIIGMDSTDSRSSSKVRLIMLLLLLLPPPPLLLPRLPRVPMLSFWLGGIPNIQGLR